MWHAKGHVQALFVPIRFPLRSGPPGTCASRPLPQRGLHGVSSPGSLPLLGSLRSSFADLWRPLSSFRAILELKLNCSGGRPSNGRPTDHPVHFYVYIHIYIIYLYIDMCAHVCAYVCIHTYTNIRHVLEFLSLPNGAMPTYQGLEGPIRWLVGPRGSAPDRPRAGLGPNNKNPTIWGLYKPLQ